MEASSHTAIRMLLSRLKLVCRMADMHLGKVSVVHLGERGEDTGPIDQSFKKREACPVCDVMWSTLCELTWLYEDLPPPGPTHKASPPGCLEPASGISKEVVSGIFKIAKSWVNKTVWEDEWTEPSARSPWRSACTRCRTGCSQNVPGWSRWTRWAWCGRCRPPSSQASSTRWRFRRTAAKTIGKEKRKNNQIRFISEDIMWVSISRGWLFGAKAVYSGCSRCC